MFHKDTNTGVEDQKGGGGKAPRAGGPWTVHTSPAVICLSKVSPPAYLPAPTDTHLTATWGEKLNPAASSLDTPPSPQSNPSF